jgi:23S rRNA (pseudouridine1915-N3)-methyltransferase
MKLTLLNVGKTESVYLEKLIEDYSVRINRFIPFQQDFTLPPKNISRLKPDEVKKTEGELLLKKLESYDYVILLDEKGKQFSSATFAQYLQKTFNAAPKKIAFVTGGAYGFAPAVYNRSNDMISLSAMTTTHQLVRLYFTEQLYRAFTIISNHPYHNE